MHTAPVSFDVTADPSIPGFGARIARSVRAAAAAVRDAFTRGAEAGAAPARAALRDAAPARAPLPVARAKAIGPAAPALDLSSRRAARAPRPSDAAPLLAEGVGPGRANRPGDVAMVQRMIGSARAGGALPPGPPLAADGAYGPQTAAALLAVQRALTGGGDGAADRGGALIGALRAVALPQGPSMQLLRLLWPLAPQARLARLGPPLLAMMARYDIASDLRVAHFLAQVGHESGELRWLEELASGAAYEGRHDLGNLRAGDGVRFKGRGLIQLTGRANYRRFGADLGCAAEILVDPGLVAEDRVLCVETAGWYWSGHGLDALADRDDLTAVTRRINGGTNGLMHRAALLARAKALLGM
jgi:predicted chitinase